MQIQLIGHASLFVETQDCKILIDPVLWDSHCEDIEDICPQRKVIIDRLPKFDTLVISHQHTDHFDIRSLACLPKHIDVLIPRDKCLKSCLRKLGYQNIYFLGDWTEVRIGSTRLLTTRSENRVPEFGMVIADNDGVFWNQVDSVVSPETVGKVKSRYGGVDFLLASWQPMLETQYQDNQSISFPYSAYGDLLKLVNLVQPRAIAPGANGFKFINGSSWLNQIVFPVTREQFCRDVQQTRPEISQQVFAFNPGDVVTIEQGQCDRLPQHSDFVNMVEDDLDSLNFCPVNVDSRLIDDNLEQYNLDELKTAIKQEVCVNLLQFINQNKNSLFLEYCHWQAVYQLEIVFPDGSQTWHFDFSEEQIQCQVGRNPLANVFTAIAASRFYSLIQGIKGWDYVQMGGYYRRFHKLYQATPYGIVQPNDSSSVFIKEPLQEKFPYKEAYQKARDYEIEKWGQVNESKAIEPACKTTMIAIGKTLTRVTKTTSIGTSVDTLPYLATSCAK
ncbi:MBL fold metallo-hydrolase [Pleurocapsa sp. PCC 7319]|uniref:MBL fold metallo-hydrolase n=1 Tax=Pleurocapsa sp. PCC 7319 TaxID=118161 RepID=UPI00034BFEA5|nr:MBL fold metallo-hydrolase [Pleurocapsa sp. PCC 7319]